MAVARRRSLNQDMCTIEFHVHRLWYGFSGHSLPRRATFFAMGTIPCDFVLLWLGTTGAVYLLSRADVMTAIRRNPVIKYVGRSAATESTKSGTTED
jgi:hypothetical protein